MLAKGTCLSQAKCLVTVTVVLAGCARFEERHFFKSVDKNDRPINYYRIKVSGWTCFASARYLSGYFDEKAVDSYFSEFSQPANTFILKKEDTTEAAAVKPIFEGLEKRRLVMILSSNSDAIAEQIGQFAENEDIMADLQALISRERLSEVKEVTADLDVRRTSGQALVNLGEQILAALPGDAPHNVMTERLLFFVNRIAAELGNDRPFASLDDAAIWIENNRGHLLRGDT